MSLYECLCVCLRVNVCVPMCDCVNKNHKAPSLSRPSGRLASLTSFFLYRHLVYPRQRDLVMVGKDEFIIMILLSFALLNYRFTSI